MSQINNSERLSQRKTLNFLMREFSATDMIDVCSFQHIDTHYFSIYCALIPSAKMSICLEKISWDLHHDQGVPSAVKYYDGESEEVEYLRFGNDNSIEPLIIDRDFHGIRENYKEISEEFRLFHNLYHHRKTDEYLKIDDAGNEYLVASITPDRISIRLKELRQFLAIKEMHLSLQFDIREHSSESLEELQLEEGGTEEKTENSCWGLFYGDLHGIGNHSAFSRLLGKRLIAPLPKSKSDFWGFSEGTIKRFSDFVIDLDECGEEKLHTCDPDTLANNFGANREAPHFLTPVHFRKSVLDKYYQQPQKFSVDDSHLSCGYLWSITIDNHHADKVCVWLGDLGERLSYEEQLHWRSHNIPPKGGVSKIYFKRQILAQFANADRPEHLFKNKYLELSKLSKKQLGWPILLPLDAADEHYFQCIRVPSSEEQRDFDELILGLTKSIIDSLNEEELCKLLSEEDRTSVKGSISRLESVLRDCKISSYADHVAFMRKLQNLRSSSSAHRKGKNYRKISSEFGIDSQSLPEAFEGILQRAVELLDFLILLVQSECLKKS